LLDSALPNRARTTAAGPGQSDDHEERAQHAAITTPPTHDE
jgi:hypothetical protein